MTNVSRVLLVAVATIALLGVGLSQAQAQDDNQERHEEVGELPLPGPVIVDERDRPPEVPVKPESEKESRSRDAGLLGNHLGISAQDAAALMDFQTQFTERVERDLLPLGNVAWYEVDPGARIGGLVKFTGEVPDAARQLMGGLESVRLEGGAPFTLDEQAWRAQVIAEVLRSNEVKHFAVVPTATSIVVELSSELTPLDGFADLVVEGAHEMVSSFGPTGPERSLVPQQNVGPQVAVSARPGMIPVVPFSDRALSFKPGDLQITDVALEELVLVDDSTRGGEFMWRTGGFSCTSAFTVTKNSNGLEGVLTAGHCDQYGWTYDDIAPAWAVMTLQPTPHDGSWGDFGWYSTTGDEVPQFHADDFNIRGVNGHATGSVNQWICWYGRTTNYRSCGHQMVAFNVTQGSSGNQVRVTNPIAQGGDSGAGYSWGWTAYGIHQGHTSNYQYFTPVNTPLWWYGLTLQT